LLRDDSTPASPAGGLSRASATGGAVEGRSVQRHRRAPHPDRLNWQPVFRISLHLASSGSFHAAQIKGGGALIDATVRSTPRKQMLSSVRARGVGALTGAHAYRRSAAALVAANERRRSASARTSWDLASSGVTRIWPVHSVQRVAPQYRS